ncbi:HupE/UreJ family protein [Pseudaminobacter arsenicus]|uniref:HupE/UreJ family protein n=1 Tax=Borborobacter arsenicus TaxID=1851146 RepID=A0A432VCK2_9HYPH|nr:HupE/UreJ family protein [Pseudaminobacter arsenicus]
MVLFLATVPTAALAHAGIGETGAFIHGFAHPFSGLDHVLAMVAIELFAFQIGGHALWQVPASFVAAMAAGGALGLRGLDVSMVEPWPCPFWYLACSWRWLSRRRQS